MGRYRTAGLVLICAGIYSGCVDLSAAKKELKEEIAVQIQASSEEILSAIEDAGEGACFFDEYGTQTVVVCKGEESFIVKCEDTLCVKEYIHGEQ